jgi:hypothetical protein
MDQSAQIRLENMKTIANYLDDSSKRIEGKNLNTNKHLKALLEENRKYLVDMMDTSYQDAFAIESEKRKRKT